MFGFPRNLFNHISTELWLSHCDYCHCTVSINFVNERLKGIRPLHHQELYIFTIYYPASGGPSIFLDRKIEGPLLAGYERTSRLRKLLHFKFKMKFMELRFKWQLILPYFHKKGCWILKKSHLWSDAINTNQGIKKSQLFTHTWKN